jgi:signal peptidase
VSATAIGATIVNRPTREPSRLRRVRGWFGTALAVVMVVLATLAIVVAVASRLSPPGQYTVFGHPVLTVMSGSMTPAIRTGDLVYDNRLSMAQAEHLHAGQIITFYTHGSHSITHTHRINAVKHVGGSVVYQTKGDANNAPDQALVKPTSIVGLYTGKIPFGGYVLYALHQPLSLILLLASPLLWLISSWLFDLAREADTKDEASSTSRGQEVGSM